MATIKYDLRHIELRIENIKNIGKILFQAGQQVLSETKKAWLSGYGADGAPLKPYSASYRKRREKEGRSTTPDMIRTGTMQRSMRVLSGAASITPVSLARTATIGASTSSHPRSKLNTRQLLGVQTGMRPNLMAASENDQLVDRVTKYVLRKIQGK